MFKIILNNTALDLGKVSVTFELKNPIFNDIGSFSYPFNLPNTPRNRAALGFPDKLHYSGDDIRKSHPAEIYFNGLLWRKGVLVVRDANDQQIKVNFGVGEGYFYHQIKDLLMNQVDMGGKRLSANYGNPIGDHFFINHYHLLYPDIDFTLFPVKMPEFFSENEYYHQQHNDSFINGYINLFITDPIPGPDPTTHFFAWAQTVFPFVNYWLKQLMIKINFTVTENVLMSDTALRQLVFWKNFTISEEWAPTQEFNPPFQFDLVDGFPDNPVADFFAHIEKLFRAHLFVDEMENSAKILLFKDIFNAAPVDMPVDFQTVNIQPNNWQGYETMYDAPSGDDYFEKYIKDIGGYNYRGSVMFHFQLPHHTTTPQVKDVWFVESERRYFWWYIRPNLAPINGQWRFLTSELLTNGEGIHKINLPGIFPRDIHRAVSGNKGQWFTFQDIDKKTEPAEIRLMFAHGVRSGKPFGSPFNRLVTGQIIAPYSLEWSGEHGLKNQFYNEYLAFHAATRQAEYLMPLSAGQLKLIDFSKKYRWDQADWLIDSIRFTITNDRIAPARVTAWKV